VEAARPVDAQTRPRGRWKTASRFPTAPTGITVLSWSERSRPDRQTETCPESRTITRSPTSAACGRDALGIAALPGCGATVYRRSPWKDRV